MTMTSTVHPGRGLSASLPRALRAWLLSACPSGTQAIRPSKRLTIILALMVETLAKFSSPFGAKDARLLRPETGF
jgi:hypothetical protein